MLRTFWRFFLLSSCSEPNFFHFDDIFSLTDLWTAPYLQVEENLQSGIGLCEKFIHTCEQLTALFWPNYIPHKWEGGPYKPDHAINVHNRLKEVLSLRTLHKQLSQLLSVSEQTEMKMNKSFDPFDKLIPVQYSPYTGMNFRA